MGGGAESVFQGIRVRMRRFAGTVCVGRAGRFGVAEPESGRELRQVDVALHVAATVGVDRCHGPGGAVLDCDVREWSEDGCKDVGAESCVSGDEAAS
jgi:hypothetical protein